MIVGPPEIAFRLRSVFRYRSMVVEATFKEENNENFGFGLRIIALDIYKNNHHRATRGRAQKLLTGHIGISIVLLVDRTRLERRTRSTFLVFVFLPATANFLVRRDFLVVHHLFFRANLGFDLVPFRKEMPVMESVSVVSQKIDRSMYTYIYNKICSQKESRWKKEKNKYLRRGRPPNSSWRLRKATYS